jgi:hypothetical protein
VRAGADERSGAGPRGQSTPGAVGHGDFSFPQFKQVSSELFPAGAGQRAAEERVRRVSGLTWAVGGTKNVVMSPVRVGIYSSRHRAVFPAGGGA